jgi:formate hydrogenlyase subunit 3/multisubunit Na+/H+ antiporter MnhD subunit
VTSLILFLFYSVILMVISNIETYYGYDTIKELDNLTYYLPSSTEVNLLGILSKLGIPLYKLSLKVSCIASIMRNLCMEEGLVKNTWV